MVPKAMLDMVLDQLSMLREQLSRMQETIEKLVEDNRKKDAIIEEKNQNILNANRARFGQSSEQRKYVLSDGQVSMFEIADGTRESRRSEQHRDGLCSYAQGETDHGRTLRKSSCRGSRGRSSGRGES